MAKGKHSTALFEVINRPARTGVAPPPVITRAPLNVNLQPPTAPPAAPTSSTSAPNKAVEIDRDRHQISLRVSYTSAVVTAFAVIVVVSLAFLVGRGTKPSPSSSATTTTEDLKKGPANPAVLNVSSATPASNTTPPAPEAVSARPRPAAPLAPSGPVAAPTNVKRIIGQNYVIMQSYPDEATAKEAQSVLLAAGIPCTIEPGPVNWVPKTWFSVIGTQSFDRVTKNPQLDAYIAAVNSVKYAEKSKFKKFDPRAYKWK